MPASRDDAATARARRLFEAVRNGLTIYFRAGDSWDIAGPAATLIPGNQVTVTKSDGGTEQVTVGQVMAERTIDGIETRTATFTRITPHIPTHAAPVHHVVDRQAATVAHALGVGLPASSTSGYCHYCGMPLDRAGRCAECV